MENICFVGGLSVGDSVWVGSSNSVSTCAFRNGFSGTYHSAYRGVSGLQGLAQKIDAQSVNANANESRTKQKQKVTASVEVAEKKKQRAPVFGKVVSIGLSHHTATVEVREKLAIAEADWMSAAQELCELDAVTEAAVLSTCNRFEVYMVCSNTFEGIQQVTDYLSKRSGIPLAELRPHLFMLAQSEAVWHLLRVSAGLDSLVIGEGQILSQVKKCYELASQKEGAAGKILNRLLITAIAAGKRVRSETKIAQGAVSISSAAVELAALQAENDLKMPLKDASVCIVGAGKMARLLVQHLVSASVSRITIVNRSVERAQELANMFPEAGLTLLGMDEMLNSVACADISFASTGASEPILNASNLGDVLSSNHPEARKMLIDISVPRNIDADVKDMADNVTAYNVDDLKAVVAKNQARRRRLLVDAENLLQEELSDFNNWVHSLGSVPAITKLQERAESIRLEEIEKMNSKLASLSDSERAAVEKLTKGIVNKMIHGPMSHLRAIQDADERSLVLRSMEAMFKL